MLRTNRQQRSGYTLTELMIATVSGSVVMAGMAASIYIASRALDLETGAATERSRGSAATDRLMSDLRLATSFSLRTPNAVTFTVPDRTGDGVADTLHYAWSGTAGDPLTLQFNGAPAATILANVQSLNLTYLEREWISPYVDPGGPRPQLLYVVGDSTALVANETERTTLMEIWGYDVQHLSDEASSVEYNDALATAAVVYVSSTASPASVGGNLDNTPIGIVNEDRTLETDLGFSSGSSSEDRTSIDITNNTHDITTGFSLGSLTLVSPARRMEWLTGTLAPGGTTLAEVSGNPALMVLETGATRHDGGASAGRRVFVPWRHNSSLDQMNADCETIMQRAIQWARELAPPAPGGVVYQGFTEGKATTDSTNVTVETPLGTAEGDLLIAAVATDSNTASSLTPPLGWTAINLGTANTSRATLGVWWKLADASESGSHLFTWSGNEQAYGWIMQFTGHDPDNPIHLDATSTGRTNSAVCPAITTTVANTMILRIGAFDDSDITVDDAGMAGHTTITVDHTSTTFEVSGGAAHMTLETAGDSGTAAFALTNTEEWRTTTIAIAPAPGN